MRVTVLAYVEQHEHNAHAAGADLDGLMADMNTAINRLRDLADADKPRPSRISIQTSVLAKAIVFDDLMDVWRYYGANEVMIESGELVDRLGAVFTRYMAEHD